MSAQSEAFKQMVGDRFGGNQQMYQDAIPTEPEPATTEEAARDSSGGVLSGVLDSIGNAVGSIVQSIDDYYTNNARQQFAVLHDENGQVTPESITETTDPQTYAYSQGITGDYEKPEENAVYQSASDPSYDIRQQDPHTFGYNFRREVNEWGDNAAQDAWKLGTDIVDGLTATSWQDLQGNDSTAADDAWKLYTDIAALSGKIAVTPFLPPQMRAIAGAVYAPKMLADIREMYNQGAEGNPEAGEEGGALAGVGNVAYGMIAQPFVGLAHDLANIDQLAADIQQNPSQLWDRVFMPATIVEAGVKGGRKAYNVGKDLKNTDRTIESAFDEAIPHAIDSIGEEGGFEPIQERVPEGRVSSIDTGYPEFDGIVTKAANTYDAPLDLNKGDVEAALRDYNGGGDPNYVEHVLPHTDYDDISGEASAGGAYEAGASAWMGEGMPNGANGCVDAVVRIGSYYDSFLKDEADKGISRVPTLVDDAKVAGREVIPFDESALEKGDIIVYGDNDHVVTYDGNGGYVGNSSSLGKIVHGGDYTQMDGLRPTKIIKTSDRSGGGIRDFADGGDMFADDSERGGSKTEDGPKDLDGNDIYAKDEPEPFEDETQKALEESPVAGETPEQVAEREAQYKERYSNLDEEIERLEAERQRDIDDEVERMKRNPGGKGVDQGHFESLEGENVRWPQSNNPQWYQDAYAKLGRPPRKSEYAKIAEENLSQFEEFGRRDEDIRWFKHLRDELKKDTDRDIGELMQEGGGLVPYEKKGGGKNVKVEGPRDDAAVLSNAEKARGQEPGFIRRTANKLISAVQNAFDNKIFSNTETGAKAVVSHRGAKKMLSDKAIAKSIRNGFTAEDHFKAVTEVPQLFERARRTSSFPDRNGSPDIAAIERYEAERSDGSVALLTVKDYTQPGTLRHIYSVELEALEKPTELKNAPGTRSSVGSEPTPPYAGSGAQHSREALSTSNIPRNGAEGNTLGKNNLTQADRTNRAGMGTLEHGEAVPDSNGNMPVATLPKAKSKGVYEGEVTNKGIFDRVRELFGTVRTGRVPRDTNGVYDRGSDVARVGSWGNWDTMWHEIGHKVDQYLGLSDKAGMKYLGEFTKALSEKYNGNIPYRADQFAPEGIAEFMKTYMTKSEDAARQKFPKYFDDWKQAVSKDKDLSARVAEMRDAMQKYNDLPRGGKIKAGIQPSVEPTFKEKVQDFVNHFVENWIDDKWGLKQAENEAERIIGRKLTSEESAYVYARIAIDRGTSSAAQLLTGKNATAVTKALNKLYGGVLDKAVTLPQIIEKLDHLDKTEKAWLREQGFKDSSEALSSYLIANSFLDAYNLKEVAPLERAQQKLEEAHANLKKAENHLRAVRGEAPIKHAKEVYEQAKKDAESAKAEFEKAQNKHYKMPLPHGEYEAFVKSAPDELKKAAQDVYDLNHNILRIMEHGGLISTELRKALERDHPHYASLARVFEDDADAAGMGFGPSKSFINVTNNLKRLTDEGSVRDVRDPLQTMTQNIVKTLTAVERNKVGQKFTDMSEMYGVGGIVEKASGTPKTLDSTFYVWRDGEKLTYQTTPEIYRSLKSLKPEGADTMMRYLAELPARWFRAGAVTFNMSFLGKNAFRDQLTAYLFSEYGYIPFYDFAKGVYHMLKQDEMYHEFKSSGVLMSTVVNANKDFVSSLLKDAQRTKPERVFQALNPLANLEKLSNFIEEGTRLGLYNRARSHGASILDATREAREGTLDFGRAGAKGRSVNRYSPFFNAAIQDPVLFMEKFKANPARMMKRLAPMVLGSLALYAIIQSNDQTAKEYDEMMSYEKNMFWNVPVPKSVCQTGWLRFPKPFGPGFLFASMPERMADLVKGRDKDGKRIKEWAKDFTGQMVPGALPPLLQAVLEWQTGYSFFQDRNVVPQREKDLPAHMQYGPRTSELAKYIAGTPLAKWLSEDGAFKVDMSPRKIDNLGQNLFAGSYNMITNATDTLAGRPGRNNNPLATFTVDPYKAPQSIQDFYEALGKANQDYSGAKHMGKTPKGATEANHKMMTKANKAMSELNKQEQAAVAAGDDAKVDIINRKQLKLAQSALAQLKK